MPTSISSAFTATWEARLAEQERAEDEAKQALCDGAESYLDHFRKDHSDTKTARMEKNRKAQDELCAEKERSLEEARRDDISRWRRVYDLIDNDVRFY